MAIDPVSASIQVATAITQTVSQISDQNKRRNYEFAIARLNADEQNSLNRKLAAAGTQNERLAILANAIATIKAQEAASLIESGNKKQTTLILLVIGGGLALLVAAYLIKKQ